MRLRERDMNHKITKTAAIELENNCESLDEAKKDKSSNTLLSFSSHKKIGRLAQLAAKPKDQPRPRD